MSDETNDMEQENQKFELNFILNSLNSEKVELNIGETLFKEGESNDYVFFILEGSIKVLKSKWVIGITYPLEFVGITSCLSETSNYTFSSKALERSIVLKIRKMDFKNLLMKNSTFCKQIIEILCARIKLTDFKTKNYIENTSKQRLLFEILLNSKKDLEGQYFTNLLPEDFSELTGLSIRNIKKQLNELQIKNLIEINTAGVITLLEKEKMESILREKR